MTERFGVSDWKKYVPVPVDDEHPEYLEFYYKTWELAFNHIKNVPGMPQNPYMDEAFCATQLWIWDSCFMSLFCKFCPEVFPGVETLDNFYSALYEGKRFPTIITPQDEPSWTGAAPGEPFEIKLHIADNPPLFAWAEYENALIKGDREHLKRLLYEKKYLQKHYDWFENLREPEKRDNWSNPTCAVSEECGYRWEGGRSGMDNTPRGRTGEHALKNRPNNPDLMWIDLICQQALAAKTIAGLYRIMDDEDGAAPWDERYLRKKELINALYRDENDGFYYDIDRNTHGFVKVKTIASYWALTCGAADGKLAESLVNMAEDPNTFGGAVPLVSLSRDDADFGTGGKYWRGALWLPTAYAALKGFIQYGYADEARAAAEKIVRHMYRTYADYEPHSVWECYDPDKCRPGTQVDGKNIVRSDFCGWSALGPIAIYLEFALGFNRIDAFTNTVCWAKPDVKGKVGIRNLKFGSVVTDITAEGNTCTVISDGEYTLIINEKPYRVKPGVNRFIL